MIFKALVTGEECRATYASEQLVMSRVDVKLRSARHRHPSMFRKTNITNIELFFFYVTINSIMQQVLTIYNAPSLSYSIVIETSADVLL